jgi:hypothetical protein
MKQEVLGIMLSLIIVMVPESQEVITKLDFNNSYGNPKDDPIMFFQYARRGDELLMLRYSKQDFERFRLGNIEYRSDGYGYKRLFGKEYIVVPGPHDTIFVNTEGNDFSMYRPDVKTWESTEIEKITATSYLKETSSSGKVVEHRPENMMYVISYGYMGELALYYHLGMPWVEGERGSGIGTEITIQFNDQLPRDHVLILNGYVDFGKRHLYKANNRVKMFRVKSVDDGMPFVFTWNLEDAVKIQEIKFPRLTKKVKLEILEVYKGNRWDDTCIRGVLLKDINWTGEKVWEHGNTNFLNYIKRTEEELDDNLRKFKRY